MELSELCAPVPYFPGRGIDEMAHGDFPDNLKAKVGLPLELHNTAIWQSSHSSCSSYLPVSDLELAFEC